MWQFVFCRLVFVCSDLDKFDKSAFDNSRAIFWSLHFPPITRNNIHWNKIWTHLPLTFFVLLIHFFAIKHFITRNARTSTVFPVKGIQFALWQNRETSGCKMIKFCRWACHTRGRREEGGSKPDVAAILCPKRKFALFKEERQFSCRSLSQFGRSYLSRTLKEPTFFYVRETGEPWRKNWERSKNASQKNALSNLSPHMHHHSIHRER